MSATFKDYSGYYDLLYKDKDYAAETDYIAGLIRRHAPDTKTILNLGCGTGKHDYLLAEKGYQIAGIDLSHEMVAIANEKQSSFTGGNKPFFQQGDIRHIRLNRKFDAVISLFHVMSYQTANEDIEKTLTTAAGHLADDGIFIFDCWYGPAVLTDRPHKREKNLEDASLKVKRMSTPVMYPNENCVDVVFDVTINKKSTKEDFTVREVHKMRYLFMPELLYFFASAGLHLVQAQKWMSDEELGFDTWNATFILRKK